MIMLYLFCEGLSVINLVINVLYESFSLHHHPMPQMVLITETIISGPYDFNSYQFKRFGSPSNEQMQEKFASVISPLC